MNVREHNALLIAALEKAVADYGKPGGPWNVPREPGTWIDMAHNALAGLKITPCPFCGMDTARAIGYDPGHDSFVMSCSVYLGGCGAKAPPGETVDEAEANWQKRVK